MSSPIRHFIQAWFFSVISIPVLLIFLDNEKYGLIITYLQILMYGVTFATFVLINNYKVTIIEKKVFIAILLIASYSTSTHGFVPAILMLLSFLFAVALYSLPLQITRKISIFSAVVVFSSVIFYLILVGANASSDLNRNLLSVFLVSTQVFYTASEYRATRKLTLFLPFITVILCIFSYGRTGIITSLFFFSVVVYYKYQKSYVVLIPSLCLLLIMLNADFLANFFQENTNFASGFVSARWDAWDEYINTMTLRGFFYGVDLYTLEFATLGGKYNPESSFILGHSRYGITYIIFLFSIIFSIIAGLMSTRDNTYFYLMLYLVLLARAFADSVALPGPFDFVYFYVFFIVIKQSSSNLSHFFLPKN